MHITGRQAKEMSKTFCWSYTEELVLHNVVPCTRIQRVTKYFVVAESPNLVQLLG